MTKYCAQKGTPFIFPPCFTTSYGVNAFNDVYHFLNRFFFDSNLYSEWLGSGQGGHGCSTALLGLHFVHSRSFNGHFHNLILFWYKCNVYTIRFTCISNSQRNLETQQGLSSKTGHVSHGVELLGLFWYHRRLHSHCIVRSAKVDEKTTSLRTCVSTLRRLKTK